YLTDRVSDYYPRRPRRTNSRDEPPSPLVVSNMGYVPPGSSIISRPRAYPFAEISTEHSSHLHRGRRPATPPNRSISGSNDERHILFSDRAPVTVDLAPETRSRSRSRRRGSSYDSNDSFPRRRRFDSVDSMDSFIDSRKGPDIRVHAPPPGF